MGQIRLLLALIVAVVHLPRSEWALVDMRVCIVAFFIISGFYMSLVLNEKYVLRGPTWIKDFLAGRIIRIFPTYLFVLLVTLVWFVANGVTNVFTSNTGMSFGLQVLLVFSNVTVVGQDILQLLNDF